MAPDVSRNVRPSIFSCILAVLFVFLDSELGVKKIKKNLS